MPNQRLYPACGITLNRNLLVVSGAVPVIFAPLEHEERPLHGVMSGARIRQKFAKKRSLHGVNEHFSQIFNATIVPRSSRAKVSKKMVRSILYPSSAMMDRLYPRRTMSDWNFALNAEVARLAA